MLGRVPAIERTGLMMQQYVVFPDMRHARGEASTDRNAAVASYTYSCDPTIA